MDQVKVQALLQEAHRILFPGEYGLGSEAISYPDDDKEAWVRLGEIVEEISKEVQS